MALDNGRAPEEDLERTDRLPILVGGTFDEEFADDAVRMDHTTATRSAFKSNFAHRAGVDLPSLADNVRSVEERIARQTLEYDALSRLYNKMRAAESAAATRAQSLTVELTDLRATLEAEQRRSSETDQAVAERIVAAEITRSEATTADLKSSLQSVAVMTQQLASGAKELESTRLELDGMRTQANAYLEQLRTREWRRGFDHNMFRELDAQIGAAHDSRGELQVERDRLRDRVSTVEATLAARDEALVKLTSAAQADATLRSQYAFDLSSVESARAQLATTITRMECEHGQLHDLVAMKDVAIAATSAAGVKEVERLKQLLSCAEVTHCELSAQVTQLRTEALGREEEADVKWLIDELAAKAAVCDALTEENRNLRLALEHTKEALAEREFFIRRLEYSESNNANVPGRIQTSIERLGIPSDAAGVGAAGAAAQPLECVAELTRTDGQHNTAHTLLRRTRLGRAPGCELQIDSSSVSRHHALVTVGQRDVIIEDLKSTNGVVVNGRKIVRQLLNDGDLLTIGDAQFRFNMSFALRTLEVPAR